ncbi:phosphoglucomutase/phosphomannomutase PgmG [Limibacillus sp. MBR-115]|jgi:phosphomannomutase|uniref:phosphoglucomutase/phosphomannomutase PgmG n=1 Tax=Limibacillus sp. MBR-115 TaxID=3156465 RepID=UPI00339654F8
MAAGYHFDPSILREYDIRGKVGETLSDADAYALGRAYGSYAVRQGAKSIAVGFDGRLSSPDLADALSRGLQDCGLEALRIEMGPTPMLYFAAYTLVVDGGIMVTGSHNPPAYNGFKMVLRKKSVFGAEIQRLGEIAARGDFVDGIGSESHHSVMDAYIERLSADFAGPDDLTVVWDAGNGAAGEVMRRLTERLPGRHVLLFAEIDGTFPNHHPDPTVPGNLVQLQEAVKREGADLGVAFDGDGDRLGAVDASGGILFGDQIMLLLAREVLRDNPGAHIIADVKSSNVLFDGIAAAGGKPVMWKTGHSLIKSKMLELGSPFAGEMSAHLFFNDRYYGFDDGLYAAVRLLTALKRLDTTLKAFRDSLPHLHNTPEVRLPCSEARKFEVVNEVADRLSARNADVVAIDGVRVNREEGWWLLRASNTQDVLVARCESDSAEGLARLKAEVLSELRLSGLHPDPF